MNHHKTSHKKKPRPYDFTSEFFQMFKEKIKFSLKFLTNLPPHTQNENQPTIHQKWIFYKASLAMLPKLERDWKANKATDKYLLWRNLAMYKNAFTPWPSEIYFRNKNLVQNRKSQHNMLYYRISDKTHNHLSRQVKKHLIRSKILSW